MLLAAAVATTTSCHGAGGSSGPLTPAPPVAAVAAQSAPGSILDLTYREPANVFEILDNVSNWWPDRCEAEYRAYWQERFGITAADEKSFAAYKEIRERYYAYPADEPSSETKRALLGRRKPADRVAEVFYEAATVAAAYASLAELMKPHEIEIVKSLLETNRAKVDVLLAESRVFTEVAAALEPKLNGPQAIAYYRRLARFYGVAELPRFTVLYVWWPPVDATAANSRGRYLLLKYNPLKHRADAASDIEVPVHELAHYVSTHQPEPQKKALADTFVAGCDVTSKIAPVKILEEPLAVVHQKLFLGVIDPKRLDVPSSWYGDPWVGTFAKLIYDQVRSSHASGRTIDQALMKTMAKSCAQLTAAAALLSR